eukprot:5225081-Prymnesium_polylepis.1
MAIANSSETLFRPASTQRDRCCTTECGTHTTSENALSCWLWGCRVIGSDPKAQVHVKVRGSVAPERREGCAHA